MSSSKTVRVNGAIQAPIKKTKVERHVDWQEVVREKQKKEHEER